METIREIPGFRDVRLIGHGGSGLVYRAVYCRTETAVAIKILYPSVDRAIARRFRRERLIMRRLAGIKGVVGFLDAGDLPDGSPYIVMEYCEGGSLVELLKSRGPLDWQDAAALISNVANTVAVAHDAGVCHRDLKPANILLTSWGATRVIDFGSSQIGDDDMATGSSSRPMLTLAYAPPEVFADREVDYKLVDVYSLAATLWALLVGHRPFRQPGREDSPMALIARIANEPIGELPAEVPDALRLLVEESMAKDPGGRPQSMAEFAARLHELDEPVQSAGGRRRSIGGFAVTSMRLSNASRDSRAASATPGTALDQLTRDPIAVMAQTTGRVGQYSHATMDRHHRMGGRPWYRATAIRSAAPAGLVALLMLLTGVLVGNGRSDDDELAADASVEQAAAVAGGADRSTSNDDQSGVITPADPTRTEAAGAGPAEPAGAEPDSTAVASRVDWTSPPKVPVSLPGNNPRTAPERGSRIPESDGSPAGSPAASKTEPPASQRPSATGSPATSPPPRASGATTVPATPVVNSAPTPTPTPAVASTVPPTVASTTPPTVASTTTTAQARFVFDDRITIEGDDDDEVKIKVLNNDDPGQSSFNKDSLRVLAPPSHAASHRVHNDHLHYRPAPGFVGTDRIVYEVCTDDLRCGRATVTITVTADD